MDASLIPLTTTHSPAGTLSSRDVYPCSRTIGLGHGPTRQREYAISVGLAFTRFGVSTWAALADGGPSRWALGATQAVVG